MTGLLIFSFLAGAVLGQRFRVMVLLPLTVAIVLVATPVCVIAGVGLLDGLTGTVLAALALQAGYLFGSAARFALAAARATRVLGRPLKTAR